MSEITVANNQEHVNGADAEVIHELGAEALNFSLPPDDDFDDLWLEEDKTPEQEAAENKLDLMSQLYGMGVEIPEGEEWEGVTAADMRAWHDSLDADERTNADEARKWNASIREIASKVRAEIEKSAPELLTGRLPADMEQLLDGKYQLGVNQSGTESLADAQATLEQYNGIDMGMYGTNLDQRFLIVDSSMPDAAEDAVTYGYYGHREGTPTLGKFIAALPGEGYQYDLPADFWVSNGNNDGNRYRGDTSVSAKYIAGYIDEYGSFHRNANFMRSNAPDLDAELVSATQGADWL